MAWLTKGLSSEEVLEKPAYEELPSVRPAHRQRLRSWPFSTRGTAIRLFVSCWLVYGLHFATNTVREIYPALSLGDHLSFDVAEYAGMHPDIFELPGRGTFINNNPGASILGAIPYTLSRPIIDRVVERVQRSRSASPKEEPIEYNTVYPMAQEFYREARARGFDVKFGLSAWVMQAFCMAPLSALSVVVMFYMLLKLTSSIPKALLLALLYGIATPVLYRTAQLNQNLLVSHFALFSFALLWRPWADSLRHERPNYLLAGLLSGWAVVLDYSGLVVLVAISIYAVVHRRSLPVEVRSRGDMLYFAAGVGFCAAVLMAYQWVSFGNPLHAAQHYMPATQLSGHGYRGIDWPQLDLLWSTAFGHRFGLFTSAPILVLALYLPAWFTRRRIVPRTEMWFIATYSLAFFLFCAANQYGRLQFNSGVRHVVPVTPFLFLLAAGVLLQLPTRVAWVIGIFAAYWSWSLAMYRDVELGLGIFESPIRITLEGFRLPWLTTLERMGYLNGPASALPPLALCFAFLWVLWSAGRRFQEPHQSTAM